MIKVRICLVERGDEVFIPNGDFVLLGGDRISVASKADVAAKFFKRISVSIGKSRDVILLGGGKISFYLAKNLIASGASEKILIVVGNLQTYFPRPLLFKVTVWIRIFS